MDLSVVIIAWQVKDKLKNNLNALLTSVGLNFEVIVVDNNSQDGTAEMIKYNFPQIKLITNSSNLGFARACNQAIKQASGRYLLLLNPDMKVEVETLSQAIKWLDNNPQAAIAGIKLVDEQGKILPQVRQLPSLFDQFLVASKLAHILPYLLNNYLVKKFDYTKPAKVPSVRGSFFIIRRSTLEILGLLDERYFVWFEEVDYCRQAAAKNLEIWYTPVATAVDYVGQSFKQLPRAQAQQYFKTSMLAYFTKWHSAWQVKILQFGWWLGSLVLKFKK